MITLEQAARQVVEDWEKGRFISTSIIELREALAEHEEPYADKAAMFAQLGSMVRIDPVTGDVGIGTPSKTMGKATNSCQKPAELVISEQAEQEPVGHLCEASFGRGQVFWFNKPADNTPLYASPVRTKDLTDDEIDALIDRAWDKQMSMPEIVRAAIAADREKNK